MFEGYHAVGDDECKYSWLDEFLCEYVDGTMDPAVRASFEEYLRGDPELAAHVECLRRTRHLLGHYGCRLQAPCGLQARLRRQLACEMVRTQDPRFSSALARLSTFAVCTSAVLGMLLAGMLTGLLLFAEQGATVVEGKAQGRGGHSAETLRAYPHTAMQLPRADYPFHVQASSFSSMPLLMPSQREHLSTYSHAADSLWRGLQRTSSAP